MPSTRELAVAVALAVAACAPSHPEPSSPTAANPGQGVDPADAIHRDAIVIDTHNDVTQRLVLEGVDLTQRLPDGHTDVPRMREGGLDAEFLSVFVPPKPFPGERAYAEALHQFGAIEALVRSHPDDVTLARSAGEVRAGVAAGRTVFLIGVEGGHALGDAPDDVLLERLAGFYARGGRYMTLTWSNSNRLGGSSGDDGRGAGLTPFGRRVVAAMNDLGMVVDVSHVSDATFFDAVRASRLPVLASHSSARAIADRPRNMTDDMLRAVRDNGGAVCVNFGPQFLDADWAKQLDAVEKSAGAAGPVDAGVALDAGEPADASISQNAARLAAGRRYRELVRPLPRVPAARVIDHIDHIVKVAGVDHVCLGSDFDGVPATPEGLDDVSKMPFITRALLARGYTPDDVRKILGENVLRVLAANESGARPGPAR